MEMTYVVMKLKVLTMIITLRDMERTHLVMLIRVTENAIPIFLQCGFLANGIGSAGMD